MNGAGHQGLTASICFVYTLTQIHMKTMIRSSLLCWLLLSSVQAQDKPSIVFQIGAPDGDYHEFAITGKHADYPSRFPNDADFVVGQSDPQKDWPFILPGPGDPWAGRKSHVFKVHFKLPQTPGGFYRLVVDFVSTHPSNPPLLAIEINGAHLEYKTAAGSGDRALTDPKAGRPSSIQQVLPSAVLRAGDNTISLTTLTGSWVLFDDVRLESGWAAPEETVEAKAEALPFFKRGPEGLERGVKLTVNNLAAGAMPAEVTWRSGGGSGSQKLDLHFGQNEFSIGVPDVERVELSVRAAQREIKLPVTLPPARKWRVYVVPTTHTDVGYTDLQDRVKVRHAENGLCALKWLDEYPFFKWYSETYWQLDALLELHPQKTDEVFTRMRERRLGLSGGYANMLTGLCSCESFNRLALDSSNLARRGGFQVNSAILDDVPSAIGSLPMVLAHSGIKYFI
jgi:alpha-mannosidase